MLFFSKKKSSNVDLVSSDVLLANAKIIVSEISVINKALMEMKAKHNPFIPSAKLDELIKKYADYKLPKEIEVILNQKNGVMESCQGNSKMISKLLGVFTDTKSHALKINADEINENFKLISDLYSIVNDSEELILGELRTKNQLTDSDIKTVEKMKEVDSFMIRLVDSNKKIGPAIKNNLEIVKANHHIAFMDSSIKQADSLMLSVKKT